jgi:hypothetical protein
MLRDEEWSGVDAIKIEVFCQHCGQYLHTRANVERGEVASARIEARGVAQAHANDLGSPVDVTIAITVLRSGTIAPDMSSQE